MRQRKRARGWAAPADRCCPRCRAVRLARARGRWTPYPVLNPCVDVGRLFGCAKIWYLFEVNCFIFHADHEGERRASRGVCRGCSAPMRGVLPAAQMVPRRAAAPAAAPRRWIAESRSGVRPWQPCTVLPRARAHGSAAGRRGRRASGRPGPKGQLERPLQARAGHEPREVLALVLGECDVGTSGLVCVCVCVCV